MSTIRGKAYLVGAGPGDLGLVTLRAKQLVAAADVLIYDHLSNPEILRWAKTGAEKIYAGKRAGDHALSQEKINELLLTETQKGKKVVRLKGGDPFVFGRGGEEAEALVEAGCDFEIVPGVSSAIAVPAYAGIPVTHRDFTSSFTVITGHEDPTKKNSALYWKKLAEETGTRIFLMSVERIRLIADELLGSGADPKTPVAATRWGTTGRQMTIEGTLDSIADLAEVNQLKPPAVLIMGKVVALRSMLNWFEQRPLFGKRIVVTRTRAQASVLSETLRELGAEVLEIPTIQIVPQPLSVSEKNQLRSPGDFFDWIVFTSPNAVELFFIAFFELHDDIRTLGEVKLAAVGSATEAKLKALHLTVEKKPAQFTTAALASSFTLPEVVGKRFLLPRGNLGDPQLAAHLQKEGGKVTEWTLYRTEPDHSDENGAKQSYEEEGADWITFTSSSTAENWHALHLKNPAKPPLCASIGPVTSATLRKLGYEVEVEANVFTIEGLVEALLQKITEEKMQVI